MTDVSERVRVDRWLWAARFVKSRSLATEAVKGGRVQVNGARVKPSKEIRAGDRVEIALAGERRTVVVRALAEKRGPAAAAVLLYAETAESVADRERAATEARLARAPGADRDGRPTKRDRRVMDAARGRAR
ncbi:MAG: RNA-binding S4 domain-containing protein [Solirubrobacteraceae bacterium]